MPGTSVFADDVRGVARGVGEVGRLLGSWAGVTRL